MTEIGQATWLSRSLRSRVYNHLSREYSFASLIYQCCPIYIYENGCWSQPLVIYIRYTQAKWVVGHVWLSCKMFLLNSSVSFLEYTDRKVVPYLVIVGIPLPNTCLRFWLYTIYVEREMKAFLLVDIYLYIDIIIISKGFLYKDSLASHKGKTRSVIRRGLMRYRLLVQTV